MQQSNSLRLLIVITGLSTGGAETMLLKVLERIDRGKFSPHVISLTGKGEIGPSIEALGIPVEALGMNPGKLRPGEFLKLIARLRPLQPDIVHTWMYHADLLGGLAARLAGIKAVGWAVRHSNLSPQLNKRTTLWIVRACSALSRLLPRRILCCSVAAKAVHVAIGYDERKMVVVPNGFDLNHFRSNPGARAEVRKKLGLSKNTPVIGMIARHNSQKNHSGFFKAAGLIHRRCPNVHFLLAGSGVDDSNRELKETAEAAGVADVTFLLGRQENMPRLMAALDILASSSHGEAFPNVLGEAMSCGVPCVVTDVGDSADIVGDTGRVVPPEDMAGLARNIIELIELPEAQRRELGERARKRVMEKFDIMNVVQQYEKFYESLVT